MPHNPRHEHELACSRPAVSMMMASTLSLRPSSTPLRAMSTGDAEVPISNTGTFSVCNNRGRKQECIRGAQGAGCRSIVPRTRERRTSDLLRRTSGGGGKYMNPATDSTSQAVRSPQSQPLQAYLAQLLQLLNGCGPVHVRCHQQNLLALLGQQGRQLAARRGLAHTLVREGWGPECEPVTQQETGCSPP